MRFGELLLIAVSLSMDAFAVALCKGLATSGVKWRQMAITGAYFGGFQALMPLIGYFLGWQFRDLIESVDHWVAFILLSVIGINMIRESLDDGESVNGSFGLKAMLPLAVGTSIDALAVGVTFAFLQVNITVAVSVIGSVTFLLSAIGVAVGCAFGSRFRLWAEMSGGIILIVMGAKILLEHLGIL